MRSPVGGRMRGLADRHRIWIDVITIIALGVAISLGPATRPEPPGPAVDAAAHPLR